jgi:hypothetical protein
VGRNETNYEKGSDVLLCRVDSLLELNGQHLRKIVLKNITMLIFQFLFISSEMHPFTTLSSE